MPATWGSVMVAQVEFSGWCFHEWEPVKKLIMHAGEDSYECALQIERKDVKNVYPKYLYSENSGFSVKAAVATSGEKPVWFETFLGNGEIIKIDTGKTFHGEGLRFILDSPVQWKAVVGERVIFSGWCFHEQEHVNKAIMHGEGLRFILDSPVQWKAVIGERVTFSGWCFHEQEHVNKVIMHAGDVSYDCTYQLERKDVREKYREYECSGESGFCVDTFFYTPGERSVWFDIVSENGKVFKINCGNILNIEVNDSDTDAMVNNELISGFDDQVIDFYPASSSTSKNVGFTITGKNCTHYALTLRESFLKHNPDYEFIIVFMDWIYERDECKLFRALDAQGVEFMFWSEVKNKVQIDLIEHMLFKYNIPGINTAIKPFVFQYLMKCGYEKIIYLDSDIYLKSPLSKLTKLLDTYDIVLIPHILGPKESSAESHEPGILLAGIFNLGFIALRMSQKTHDMCRWWEKKLFDGASIDQPWAIHNDQKWMEFVQIYYDNVYILEDKGYNVACWNLHERRLSKRNGAWYAGNSKLVFFDFSGLPLHDMEPISKRQNRFKLSDFPGLNELFEEYRDRVLEHSPDFYISLPYYFDYIPKTDIKLPDFVRKYYYDDVLRDVPMPFKPDERNVKRLIRCLTGDVYSDGHISKIARWIWNLRPDLQIAFPNLDEDHIRDNFRNWFLCSGQLEYGLHEMLQEVDTGGEINPAYKTNLLGLNIIGYFSYGFGVAETARFFVKKIYKGGIPFTLFNVDTGLHQRSGEEELREFKPYFSEKPLFDVNMFFINADQIIDNIRPRFPYLFKEKYNIGVFWWELDDYFDGFKKVFDYINHVLVFTDFTKKAVEKVAPSNIKITKLPYPFLENWKITASPAEIRRKYALSDDDYIFMYNFDFLSTAERKNPEAVVKAFSLAFAGKKDIKLLLKTSHSQRRQDKLKRLLSEIEECAITHDVIMVHETLTRNEIISLTNAVDCYVSLHRSEGLGLGIVEAMYLGKPVIATRYGGNLDFMNDDNSILVNYSMTALKKDALPYKKGWIWADPDVEEAAACMARIYEDRDYARQLGRKAEEAVKKRFDVRVFTRELYAFLESL